MVTSGALWSFWGAYALTSVLLAARHLTVAADLADLRFASGVYSFAASLALVCASFLLTFWSDVSFEAATAAANNVVDDGEVPKSTAAANPSPERISSFPSKLTLAWFTELAWQGFRRDLTLDELWDLDPELSCRRVHQEFERNLGRARRPAGNVYVRADGGAGGDHHREIELRTPEEIKAAKKVGFCASGPVKTKLAA